jgi:hypothetical protein
MTYMFEFSLPDLSETDTEAVGTETLRLKEVSILSNRQ